MTSTQPSTQPRRSTDECGRVIPLTEAQVKQRAAEAIRALDALDDMGSEQEQRETLDALLKGLDEDRLSYRRRTRECD